MTDFCSTFFRKKLYFLKVGFSFLFVFGIFYYFDPVFIFGEVQKTSLPLYVIVVLGHFVLLAIKALRWKILLESFQIQCSYKQALKAYITAFAFGTFTPGQLGDMAKVMLIDGARGRRKLALIPSLGDRLWDLAALCLVSVVGGGILFWSHIEVSNITLYGAVFCVLCAGMISKIYPVVRKLVNRRVNADISLVFTSWPSSLVLTLLVVIVQVLRWSILSIAMGLPVITATIIAMLGTLVALIPVSFGGLGTREAAMAALFSSCGLASVSGVSFSLLMFGAYLFGAVAGALLFYTYKITLPQQESRVDG